MPQLTWLVTGCSSGFGADLALEILSRGDRVIATARGGVHRLERLQQAGAATMEMDVSASQDELNRKVAEAIQIYSGIDVVVNNAGYIEAGLVEDLTHERMLASLNTNLFGTVNVTRAVLPHFRQKKSGVVAFVGSIGGWQGAVGGGAYCAAKFAMEGVIECLQKEVEPFGIRTIIFEPAHYRTKVMHEGNVKLPPLKIPEYQEIHDAMAAGVKGFDGNQPGDPKKGAKLMVDVIKQEGPAQGKEIPPRLPMGPLALEQIRDKCLATLKLIEEWETEIMEN